MTSRTVSVTWRAITTASSGSLPALRLMNCTSSHSRSRSLSGESSSSGGCCWAGGGFCPRRNQDVIARSGTDRRRAAAAGQLTSLAFAATGALEVGLGAFDLSLERSDRLRHRVDGLRAEGVERVHRLEDVVEGGLQLLDVDGAGRRLFVD